MALLLQRAERGHQRHELKGARQVVEVDASLCKTVWVARKLGHRVEAGAELGIVQTDPRFHARDSIAQHRRYPRKRRYDACA